MKYEIYNKDCINGAKTHLLTNSADLIIADPPYNLKFGGTTMTKTKRPRHRVIANDDLSFKDYQRFTLEWLRQAHRVLKDGHHIYVFIDWRMHPYIALWMRKIGFEIKNLIVWDKQSMGLGWQYRFQHELVISAIKGKTKARRIRSRKTADILRVKRIPGQYTVHPTEKPTELMKIIVENSTEEGETVVDFFSGSGPVTEACLNLNRRVKAFEIDQKYYQMTVKRAEKISTKSLDFNQNHC